MAEQETTPLVNRGAGSRRRGAGPQLVEKFSSVAQENDKQDRRSSWERTKAAWKTFFAFRGGFEPPDKELYYEEDYNDFSWTCSFGTREDDGIWMNRTDQAGIIMSMLVWVLIIYSSVTIALLAQDNSLPYSIAMIHATFCALALASHAKTMFTDPGSVPQSAVPIANQPNEKHPMCSHCKTYKPACSHHCRICNRCISRMDHHCPWMNNCIGAGNIKFFMLFLIYIWVGSAFSLLIFAWNYFLCNDDSCTFSVVLVQLVRVMTLICIGSLLFTSSMLMSVMYAIITGIGTIDRMKKKIKKTSSLSDEEPIDLEDIFGIQGYYTWPIPIDPLFEDFDRVMGFSTTQRLLRESNSGTNNGSVASAQPSTMGRNSGLYSV